MLEKWLPPPEPVEPGQALEPAVEAFTQFLSELLRALAPTSITRYAARCNRDKGSVSRYLSGQRIAPRDFVDDLLRHVAEKYGRPVTPEVQEQAYRLRMAALSVRSKSGHEVEVLRERLGAAERELARAGLRERTLLKALQDAEQQAYRAEQRYRQLEADLAVGQPDSLVVIERVQLSGAAGGLRDELSGLLSEVEGLREELARARDLKGQSEDRCLRLEEQLLGLEAEFDAQRASWAEGQISDAALTRLALLSDVGGRVGTTLDLGATARELSEMLLSLADLVCVDLLERLFWESNLPTDPPDSDSLLRRMSYTWDTKSGNWGEVLQNGTLPLVPASTAIGLALRSGQEALVPVISEDLAEDYAVALGGDTSLVPLVAGCSVVALPLSARGIMLGVVHLLRLPGKAPFAQPDVSLLREAADRAALSLDNARLYLAGSAEFRAAEQRGQIIGEYQRALLPLWLPQPSGVRLAHQYLPGQSEEIVGGDWYDAVPLPGNRVALFVGDVMGHSLTSVAVMGQLRTSARTLAALDLPPHEVLYHLDELAQSLGREQHLATCVFAVYDPIANRIVLANAGHMPPVLIHPDGRAELLEQLPAGAPIGVGGVDFVSQELETPPGSALLLYTDGLVETQDQPLSVGLKRLRDRLSGANQLTPERLCHEALQILQSSDRGDDIALLAAAFDGIPANDVAYWYLQPRNETPGRARRLAGRALRRWGLDELAADTELMISELVTNAVQHAKKPITLRLVRTLVLRCEIGDDSPQLPRRRRIGPDEERGRGLELVAKCADSWGSTRLGGGKIVWFEQRLPH
ncbi:SpoIIE family protein phosphatase [Kitasatospora sp. NBC_01250]|uniref:SpoIIE family protein phosphatase n=1 Tax=Kitasatospora sp. NBC_01250 TaxID=2903571 RepID=UPI002E336450|nr:SpoIIE family protein phosphatase [Kitasatospora sp. NBC_01250]